MKIMVTGSTGLLGQAVVRVLRGQNHEVHAVSLKDFDITDAKATRAAILALRPEAIIHCAAYTAVDNAENDIARCMAVNAQGALHIARAAREVGAKLVYISTDYVFPGEGTAPYEATALPRPLNIYGLSKAQGEAAIRGVMSRFFILRTSWLFGPGGANFVRTIRRLSQENSALRVVADQVGAPTYAPDLARLIAQMVVTERYGVYHATNEGECSFAGFAAAILRATGSKCHVTPISTEEYGAPARRPKNSRLSKASLPAAGFTRLPPWEDALMRYLGEE